MKRFIAVLCLTLTGCSGWLTPARGAEAAKLTECVFLHWGEPAEEVALECGAELVDVLAVQKAAAKSMPKGCAP